MARWLACIVLIVSSGLSLAGQSWIYSGEILEGNVRTRDAYIENLIPFIPGQRYRTTEIDSLVEMARAHLTRTTLFNRVEVVPEMSDDSVRVRVLVVERWYLWPFPIVEFADPDFNIWWQEKDFSRMNYGLALNWDNFNGLGSKLKFRLKAGYNRQFRLGYSVPLSLMKGRQSFFGWSLAYNQTYEVTTGTRNNIRQFATVNPGVVQESYGAAVGYSSRIRYSYAFGIFAGYSKTIVRDTVLQANAEYLGGLPADRDLESLPISISGSFDNRNSRDYPLKGRYMGAEIYTPLVLENRDAPYLVSFTGDVREYRPLGKRWFLHGAVQGQWAWFSKDLPYLWQRGMNPSSLVRGYQLYVIDTQRWVQARSNLKFALLPAKNFELPLIPWEQFRKSSIAIYLNAFYDVGHYGDRLYAHRNFLDNRWLQGWGVGLDIVTYYGKLVRIEATQNSIGEFGVFLQFSKSI